MKSILSMICAAICSCQSTQGYKANSQAEARAYAKRAVEAGVVHKGGEEELFNRKAAGKPLTGTWDPQKIERFVAKFASDNPRLVEINLAATKGVISEGDRVLMTMQLELAEANERAARSAVISASLNNMSASLNQTTANINQNTARINQSTVNMLNSGIYTPSHSYPIYQPPVYYTPARPLPVSPLYRY